MNPIKAFHALWGRLRGSDTWANHGAEYAADGPAKCCGPRYFVKYEGHWSASLPRDGNSDALIEAARNAPPMTKEEVRAQRISFIYGQLMDCAPEVTKEQVAALVDEHEGRSAMDADRGVK